MATANQLRALARFVGRQDYNASCKLIEEIATKAEAGGKARLAEDLFSIIHAAQRQRESSLKIRGGQIQQDHAASTWITEVDISGYSLRSIVFDETQQRVFEEVLREQFKAKQLRHHNLEPARRLLLCGAPGTGKSLTAAVLAAELELPLRRVNMHMLVSRYLGETARNLAALFNEIELTRAVYLFDEFDSISRTRYSAQDSGEMDRVVNTALQLIENDTSSSLLVATTNAAEHVDQAFARRFDEMVAYKLPDADQVKDLLQMYLPSHARLSGALVASFGGLSHADIASVLLRTRKLIVLGDQKIDVSEICVQIERYRQSKRLIGNWNISDSETEARR